MPRPLKILKGIIEQDPSVTRSKVNKLLGETVETAEEALKQLSSCLHLLLEKDRASKADQSIVDLGVRFWNDIRVANSLMYEGFILHAIMMKRDAIETRVIAEYLHKYPGDAAAWQKAKTKRERYRFSINELKDKVEDGKGWKELWDDLSSYIHPNRTAVPVYSSRRPYFGHNLCLGGLYDPMPAAIFFLIQLGICINFLDDIHNWYKDDLPFPKELAREIELLEEKYDDQTNKLQKRADAEHKQMKDELEKTRLSAEEIVKFFKFLDSLP
jgi:hypothetical protein